MTVRHLGIFCALLMLSACKEKAESPVYYTDEFKYYDRNTATKTNQFYGFKDLDLAVRYAKSQQKNLLLVFGAIDAVSITDIDLKTLALYGDNDFIEEHFVIVRLIVDLPEPLKDTSKPLYFSGDTARILTVGEKNMYTQLRVLNSNTIPCLGFVDTNLHAYGKRISFTRRKKDLVDFIRSGLNEKAK